MNFEFAKQINPSLQNLDFQEALTIAETALSQLPPSEFHAVLGQSLTKQADDLAAWIEVFYKKCSADFEGQSLYFEMNEFDINTDLWFIDGFAYRTDGGLNPGNMEWLVDYEADTQRETGSIFRIDGYDKLQDAFENIEPDTDDLQNARDWCEQIILIRYMQLMRRAHETAKEKNLGWAPLPIYFTEHSYDFIVRSTVL